MTSSAPCPWLPDTAFLNSKNLSAIDRVLLEWGDHWLARSSVEVDGGWQETTGPLPAPSKQVGSGLALTCSEGDRLRLASLLLDREVRTRNLRTSQDAAAIELLVGEALADLGARVDALLGKREGDAEEKIFVVKIGVSGDHPLLALHASRSRLIAFAKAEAPPQRPLPPLDGLRSGLGQQTVGIGAIVGSAKLSLAEIEQLETGDVIVLDSRSDDALDLMIDGSRATAKAVTIRSEQSHHSLVVERTADQW